MRLVSPSLFIACLFAAAVPCPGQVMISEFLADNVTGIADENLNREDWIELFNPGTSTVSLNGWWLTDSLANLSKWEFPNVTIGPGAYLLVWASGKDRRVAGQPLHTNFSLSKNGEYLGLYKPHATTGLPVLVSDFSPSFPAQVTDVSHGRSYSTTTTTLLASGATSRYRVLSNDSTGQTQYSGTNYAAGHVGTDQIGGWNVSPAFNDSGWTAGTTGIGYDTGGGFNALIGASGGNCQTALRNVNTSLLFRTTFQVPDPAAYSSFKLRMKYEDGFVAFVNGQRITSQNFAATLAHNSTSTVALDEAIVNSWTEATIPASAVLTGTNLLAIQGLNSSLGSSDFLLLPEVTATTVGSIGPAVYFSPPTPNAANGTGTAGVLLTAASPVDPNIPRPLGNSGSPPMVVSVKAIKTQNNISSVRLYQRLMFNTETAAVTLLDNGVAPDAVAGDGIYTTSLATNGIAASQMFRWRFEAQDSAGNITKLPAYQSTTDSPQYFGTVALNPATATSQLPVLEWFVEGAPSTGPTNAAFRGACYYLNRFYDNTGHEIHGQSTAGFNKKSYDFDFNTGHRFLWKEGETILAKDINLLTNYADKTKTRNTLSQEVASMTGTPYHYCFPVRVHLNAAFHGVMDLMEDGDDRLLERNGLDPEGAFYKIYSENLTSSPEKKTRQTEPNTDFAALASGLDPATALATRRTFGYDNLNIAATVNYLVTRQLNSDRDHGHKNFYLYRDTNGTGEWRPIIWDVDLSHGHNWNGSEGYFDDDLVSNNPLNAHSTADRVYNLILESPELQQMWVRRMRTLMDTIMQPPGTVNGLLETRMRQIAATVDPDPAHSSWTDGDLDALKWGIDYRFLQNRPREEVERVISGYFGPRRTFLFDQSAARPLLSHPTISNGIPLPNSPQSAGAGSVTIHALDFYPSSTSQAAEYVILRNTTANAIDVSGWKLEGAVRHTIEPGTVIPAGAGTAGVEYRGLLHVVKDTVAFRARASSPRGGEKRFIQGNYEGQLSARGETIDLRDPAGSLIATHTYTGSPTPLQQWLRISEIHYNPSAPTAAELLALPGVSNEDFEFLELVNTGAVTLNLAGATFTQGLTWTFAAGTSLAPGARLVLAKNQAAFLHRHPGFSGTLSGPYDGRLENDGERIELTDVSGEVVLDFSYRDGWWPASDGDGRSLVARDVTGTPYDGYGEAEAWALSLNPEGTPGAGDPQTATAYRGWDNFHFTDLERDDPLVSGPDADPDGDGRKNLLEYALASDPRQADAAGVYFQWSDGKPALRFTRPRNAIDLAYDLEASTDCGIASPWSAVPLEMPAPVPSGEIETVVLREIAPTNDPERFLRLRVDAIGSPP